MGSTYNVVSRTCACGFTARASTGPEFTIREAIGVVRKEMTRHRDQDCPCPPFTYRLRRFLARFFGHIF